MWYIIIDNEETENYNYPLDLIMSSYKVLQNHNDYYCSHLHLLCQIMMRLMIDDEYQEAISLFQLRSSIPSS